MTTRPTLAAALVAALGLAGCGARSDLLASPSTGLLCPLAAFATAPHAPVRLSLAATPARFQWAIVNQPPGSTPTLVADADGGAVFSTDVQGRYVARATRVDATTGDAGAGESCDVVVNVLAPGPSVMCPGDVTTEPLQTVTLTASTSSDIAPNARAWSVVSMPPSSAAVDLSPAHGDTTHFEPTAAGDYVLEYSVHDAQGESASCEVTVHAVPTEGLRVELYWNPPDHSCITQGSNNPPGCDDSDVDLHLQHAARGTWGSSDVDPRTGVVDDCYYGDCVSDSGPGPAWDAPGSDDDPHLDRDDVDGFGPENISVDHPGTGPYRVGVHFYDGHSRDTAQAYVRIFCGGSGEPVASYGPVTLHAPFHEDLATNAQAHNDFWLVADVLPTASGGCDVRPIQHADGRPWVEPETDAQAGAAPPPPGP